MSGSARDLSFASEGSLPRVVQPPPGLTVPSDTDLTSEKHNTDGSAATVFLAQALSQSSNAGRSRCSHREGNHCHSLNRREHFLKLKARFPCVKCGALGHWKDDWECPMRQDDKNSGVSGGIFTLCDECGIPSATVQSAMGKGRFDPPRLEDLCGLLDVTGAKSVGGSL